MCETCLKEPIVKTLTIIISLIFTFTTFINPLNTPTYNPDDYPTWQEVLDARKNETATKRKIEEIQGLIQRLADELAAANREAEQAGEEYFEKQYEHDVAIWEHEELLMETFKAETEAEEAEKKTGMFIAEMAKAGSLDLEPMKIFLNPDNTGDLLSKIGYADKISVSMSGIFEHAILARNTANSLADQAETARQIREKAEAEAEEAFIRAQEAQLRAQRAYNNQKQRSYELELQLAALTTEREMTEEKYREGLAAKKAAEEAARKAEEERRRAAAASGNTNSGGTTNTTFSPTVSSSNWTRPTSGWISSAFGWRIHPIYRDTRFHAGVDWANSCGTPMYAASSGVVEYAGWLGTFGYFIRINHGNGLTTGYAHIRENGIHVSVGQQVSAGQYIADMGTTGASTGCHLHFEVRDNRVAGDPILFLRSQGVNV